MHKTKCPGCKTTTYLGGNNKFAPFCSERCKNLDLGAWAEEKYSIPDEKLSLEENINSAIIEDNWDIN